MDTITPADLSTVALIRRLGKNGTARAIREESGLSLRSVARALDVSAGELSRWERGLNSPTEAHALRWAETLRALGARL